MEYNNFFLIFLLAHLMGDFVFQTNGIAKAKTTGIKGLLVHCTIVCITQLVFLSVYGIRGIATAVVNTIIHFILDLSKNKISKYFRRMQTFLFILDQLLHIAVIYVLTSIIAANIELVNTYTSYIRVAIAIITLTYVSTVCAKLLLRDISPDLNNREFFVGYERQADAFASLILWMLCLFPLYWSILLGSIMFCVYHIYQNSIYSYRISESLIKYLVYALSALIICLINV